MAVDDERQVHSLPLTLSKALRIWQQIEPTKADVPVLDHTNEVSLAELLDLDCPFPRLSLHKPQPHVPTLRTAMLVGLFQRLSFLLSRSDGDWDDLPRVNLIIYLGRRDTPSKGEHLCIRGLAATAYSAAKRPSAYWWIPCFRLCSLPHSGTVAASRAARPSSGLWP